MKLRSLSPHDKFGEVFDTWAFDNYGLRINSAGIIDRIEISEEDYTALLLRVGV